MYPGYFQAAQSPISVQIQLMISDLHLLQNLLDVKDLLYLLLNSYHGYKMEQIHPWLIGFGVSQLEE